MKTLIHDQIKDSVIESRQSTSQQVLVHFDVISRVALVHDATAVLLLDRLGKPEVLGSDVSLHIVTCSSGKLTLVPGTLERLRSQVYPLVPGQRSIVAE